MENEAFGYHNFAKNRPTEHLLLVMSCNTGGFLPQGAPGKVKTEV
jgi:hypothetical protein